MAETRKYIGVNGKTLSSYKVSKMYRLYDYLKENAVGYESRKSAAEIIVDMFGEFESRQSLEDSIQHIRINLDRKVGSSTAGYWLQCTDDKVDGDNYIISQALSKCEVALRSGVDANIFYKRLNELKDKINDTLDQQQRLTTTEYQNTETRRYSDDLKVLDE